MLRVEIRWIDSGAYHKPDEGWQTPAQVMRSSNLSEVSTVGWFLGEDEDTYYVALSRINDSETLVYGTQLIYKPNVIGVTRLRARSANTLEDLNSGSEEEGWEDSGTEDREGPSRGVVPSVRDSAD